MTVRSWTTQKGSDTPRSDLADGDHLYKFRVKIDELFTYGYDCEVQDGVLRDQLGPSELKVFIKA